LQSTDKIHCVMQADDSAVSGLGSNEEGSSDSFAAEATVVADSASTSTRGPPHNIKKPLVADVVAAGGIDKCSAAELAKNRKDGACGNRQTNQKHLRQVENCADTWRSGGTEAFETVILEHSASTSKSKPTKSSKPKAKKKQTLPASVNALSPTAAGARNSPARVRSSLARVSNTPAAQAVSTPSSPPTSPRPFLPQPAIFDPTTMMSPFVEQLLKLDHGECISFWLFCHCCHHCH